MVRDIMRTAVYFVFTPTSWLVETAKTVGETWLVEPSVWTSHETDRTGFDHPQMVIEKAFWSRFVAYLYHDIETEDQKMFRNMCIEKELLGCWTIVVTRGGGFAEELVECGKEADDFLLTRQRSD